jgi:ribosome biogenesis protein SSF1/2
VVLFNLTFEEKEGRLVPVIEFRHFDIDIEKHSIKKTISNIINYKKTDLSKFENIADYILKQSGYTSGSDMEDPNMGLCEVIGDKEIKSEAPKEDNEKIKIKLHEIGPRINLKIQKIEEGFLKGNVTFHCHLKKSKKEIKDMMDKIRDKKKIKKERKKEQEENVNKKREEMTDEQKEHEEQGIKNKNKIYLFRSQEKERKITESQTKERRRKTKRKRRSRSYDQKQFETFTKTEARQKINKI